MQALATLMLRLIRTAAPIRRHTAGQGLVEYALILVLVAVVAIGILATVGTDITAVFQSVSDALKGGGGAPAP